MPRERRKFTEEFKGKAVELTYEQQEHAGVTPRALAIPVMIFETRTIRRPKASFRIGA